MILTVLIRNSGNVATGLTPKLYGYNTVTHDCVLNGVDMVELGYGLYTCNFVAAKDTINYAFVIDAGESVTDGNERYIFLSSESLLNQG